MSFLTHKKFQHVASYTVSNIKNKYKEHTQPSQRFFLANVQHLLQHHGNIFRHLVIWKSVENWGRISRGRERTLGARLLSQFLIYKKREKGELWTQFFENFCNSQVPKAKVKQQPELAGFCLHGTLGSVNEPFLLSEKVHRVFNKIEKITYNFN